MDVTEVIQALARIDRERDTVKKSLVSESMKQRLLAQLEAKSRELEAAIGEGIAQAVSAPPARKTP